MTSTITSNASSSDALSAAFGDKAYKENPYPAYEMLRENPGWLSPSGYRVFSRYADVQQILRSADVFGQEGIPYPNFHVLDPPDHTRLRRMVARPFTQHAINRQRDYVAQAVGELIDTLAPRGEMDLVNEFGLVLPGRVTARMLGVPAEDAAKWAAWLWNIGGFRGKVWYVDESTQADRDRAARAAAESAGYFRQLIAERQARRGDDIVSALLEAREDDDRLTDDEVLYSLVLISGAGLHTTASQMGNMMRAILEHPGVLDEIAADPTLTEGAVDESMRYDGALQAEYRVCKADTDVGGVHVERGAAVIVVIGAANRDPDTFPDPDAFDIRRANAGHHLTFGMGIHRCLGAPLARLELVAALTGISARLPGLQLAGEPVQHDLDRWRGLSKLPVKWSGK